MSAGQATIVNKGRLQEWNPGKRYDDDDEISARQQLKSVGRASDTCVMRLQPRDLKVMGRICLQVD